MGAAEMVSIVGQKAVNQTSWQASEIDRQALSLDFSYLGEWEKSVCKNKLNCQSHYQSPITKEKITRCILEKKNRCDNMHFNGVSFFQNFRKQNELFREYMMVFFFSWNTKHFAVPAGFGDSSLFSPIFCMKSKGQPTNISLCLFLVLTYRKKVNSPS